LYLVSVDDDDDVVLERTNTCLTTPYDRELIACADAKQDVVQCYKAFEFRRRGAGLPRE
jgi:hypothetical protein